MQSIDAVASISSPVRFSMVKMIRECENSTACAAAMMASVVLRGAE